MRGLISHFQVLLAAVLISGSAAAHADVIVLDFEGLQNAEMVSLFYNGSFGGFGSGPGPDFGVIFSGDGIAAIDSDEGGGGNFANEPSPSTAMIWLGANPIINVPGGFEDGVSLFFSAIQFFGLVIVYDEIDATGNVLGIIVLDPLGSAGTGDPTGDFDTWEAVGVAFGGTARSIEFTGFTNQVMAFDNITFGSATPAFPVDIPDVDAFTSLQGRNVIVTGVAELNTDECHEGGGKVFRYPVTITNPEGGRAIRTTISTPLDSLGRGDMLEILSDQGPGECLLETTYNVVAKARPGPEPAPNQ